MKPTLKDLLQGPRAVLMITAILFPQTTDNDRVLHLQLLNEVVARARKDPITDREQSGRACGKTYQ